MSFQTTLLLQNARSDIYIFYHLTLVAFQFCTGAIITLFSPLRDFLLPHMIYFQLKAFKTYSANQKFRNPLIYRYNKSQCLSRSGLCSSQDIPSTHRMWQRGSLNVAHLHILPLQPILGLYRDWQLREQLTPGIRTETRASGEASDRCGWRRRRDRERVGP